MDNILAHLEEVEDLRESHKVVYPLSTLLFISICAIFCGAESWSDISLWAKTHKDWLSKHIDISKGITSYSTIRRIFMMIQPAHWDNLMRSIIDLHNPNRLAEDHIPIDGKSLRGSKCLSKEIRAMQIVSAYSVSNNITLGEVKTDSKSNEIKAIPILLDLLELTDATISIDAIACNQTIVDAILAKDAHYLLGLKKNQPKLYAAVEKYAQTTGTHPDNLVSDYFDKSHGRCVRRRCFAFDITEELAKLGFSKMNTIIATETISKSDYEDKVSAKWRYYITDHDKRHPKLAQYIRDHWQIESMHWVLDVHLNDDRDKKYETNAAENFAKTKRLLLNLVKSKPQQGKKMSIRSHIKRVGWDLDYLSILLFG